MDSNPFLYHLDGRTVLVEQRLDNLLRFRGRRNFTIAHEIAHQILYRLFPDAYGMQRRTLCDYRRSSKPRKQITGAAFPHFFRCARDSAVLSPLGLGFQGGRDFAFRGWGVSGLPPFFCHGNFSFMMFFPVAPRADNHSVELPPVVVLGQSQVRSLPYLIAVVDNSDRAPVVTVSLLFPWLAQRREDSRHLLFAQLAPAWLGSEQLQPEALPLL